MEKFFVTICLLLAAVSIFGQTDKLILHNSKVISGKILKATEQNIVFTYDGEETENTLSRNAVHKSVYKSGREEVISEKIIIGSESDYAKVIILQEGSSVQGLKRIGEVKGKAFGTVYADMNKVKTRAEEDLKKEAAKLGACFVLIQNYQVTDSQPGKTIGKTNIAGIAYGY